MAGTTAHDYENYAELSPNFFSEDAFPQPIVDVIANMSGTFLDVGTGDGSKLRALENAGLLAKFDRIIATDLSQTRVERVARIVPGVEAFASDAQSVTLPDESVDFYYSDQVIEHVPSDAKMAADAFRLLRPGGRAFIGSVLKGRYAWYYYRSNGQWTIDPTHLREYRSEAEYVKLFADAGFSVEKVVVDALAVPVSDQILRLLVRLGLVKADGLSDFYQSRAAAQIRHLKVRIPGYSMIYAVLTKP